MRLPLTLGMSGTLHLAVLSGLALPLPPAALLLSPIQVRLFEGGEQELGPIPAGATHAQLPMHSQSPRALKSDRGQGREDAVDPSYPLPLPAAPATTSMMEPTAASKAVPLSETVRGQGRYAGESENAVSGLSGAAGPLMIGQAGIAQPSAAVIGGLPGFSGGKLHPARALPAGTAASPLQAPRALHASAPEYPEEARWEKRTGRATLGFRLEADGSVTEARMLHSSGHVDLDTAALESLRGWRFALPPGEASATWYRYVFRFELS